MCENAIEAQEALEAIGDEEFWKAALIWCKNPHVVNRRLSGAMMIHCWKVEQVIETLLENCSRLDFEAVDSYSRADLESAIFEKHAQSAVSLSKEQLEQELSRRSNGSDCTIVVIQKLLQRNPNFTDAFQFTVMELNKSVSSYLAVLQNSQKHNSIPVYPYHFKLASEQIVLDVKDEHQDDPSFKWLRDTLLPRFQKWATSSDTNKETCSGSLQLVSLDEYNDLYLQLKEKYGKNIVKIWPEATDPQKFVYEDVAIATYLLLIWKYERQKTSEVRKQSFIDLGCGNGLLVYILNSEGHPGKGIDVRKRGIWDAYPNQVKLEIEAVTPSVDCFYKDIDWIIGNHSDELTPWIPVIAARSSFNCRFFLLPCCAFDFNGKKYQRRDSSKSQYNEYLEYVLQICRECKINTKVDRLKIPSTKRTCLVGTDREYLPSEHEMWLSALKSFVQRREKSDNVPNGIDGDSKTWQSNFVPREAVEKVRNCTRINKSVIEDIIKLITTELLQEESEAEWNAGTCLPISDLVKLIPQELLNELKKECGGLQTLLKNNHHIFHVETGSVKLRRPITKSEHLLHMKSKRNKPSKDRVFNIKPCWFHNHHPNGCPLTFDECRFSHDN